MIGIVYGTTGELIKLSPVLLRLKAKDIPMFTICTGQQVEQIPKLLRDFDLPQPDLWLARGHRGHDLERSSDIMPWATEVVISFMRRGRLLRLSLTQDAAGRPLIVVHGDTFTTVLGAFMGRILRVPVAHIEAGMRSGNWRNPFPEELNRVATARLARIHFSPGTHATANLRAARVGGEIVDTGSNTIVDALELAGPDALAIDLPAGPFGLASLHRFELLDSPELLRAIVELLREASRRTPILFIDHPVTAAAIARHGLDALFDADLRRIPRQRYFQFVSLLKSSTFLVTDSGGSQQECARLGHPCLVHRAITEHPDGLDKSVVLSKMNIDVARRFLIDPQAYSQPIADERHCPSDIIVEYCKRRGYIGPERRATTAR